MLTIATILVIIAVVCLFLAAFNVPVARPSLGWFGLGCWALSTIVGRL